MFVMLLELILLPLRNDDAIGQRLILDNEIFTKELIAHLIKRISLLWISQKVILLKVKKKLQIILGE